MTSLSRLLSVGTRCQFTKIIEKNHLGVFQAIRPVTFTVQQAGSLNVGDHDEKNMKLKRPMSPHLTIYAKQIQTTNSILHRFMGGAMSIYLMGFGIGTLVLPQDISTYIEVINAMNISPLLLTPVKFLLVWPFTYHGINGVRYLIWVMGGLLKMKQIMISGYLILFLSIIMASGLAN